jgi:hypothetical protein
MSIAQAGVPYHHFATRTALRPSDASFNLTSHGNPGQYLRLYKRLNPEGDVLATELSKSAHRETCL